MILPKAVLSGQRRCDWCFGLLKRFKWQFLAFMLGIRPSHKVSKRIRTMTVAIDKYGPSAPNAYDSDELYWCPTRVQCGSDGAYPALYAFHSKLALGFFSCIFIEDLVVNPSASAWTARLQLRRSCAARTASSTGSHGSP